MQSSATYVLSSAAMVVPNPTYVLEPAVCAVGATFSVQVGPAVLPVGFTYDGMGLIIESSDPAYSGQNFIFDWIVTTDSAVQTADGKPLSLGTPMNVFVIAATCVVDSIEVEPMPMIDFDIGSNV